MELLLAGATGLVGRAVLDLALADAHITRIVAPTRRPLPPSPRLENPIVDFEALPQQAPWWHVDAAISTLGTTIARAGSQEAFRRVDHIYILTVARLARQGGARAFALTSAIGADPASRVFYNRVKGETERSVEECGFESLTIVRPGLIGGTREESRPAEFAAKQVVRALGPLLPRRYRINPPGNIARALLSSAVAATPGRHIVTSERLV